MPAAEPRPVRAAPCPQPGAAGAQVPLLLHVHARHHQEQERDAARVQPGHQEALHVRLQDHQAQEQVRGHLARVCRVTGANAKSAICAEHS